jgi:hypothetical protein
VNNQQPLIDGTMREDAGKHRQDKINKKIILINILDIIIYDSWLN